MRCLDGGQLKPVRHPSATSVLLIPRRTHAGPALLNHLGILKTSFLAGVPPSIVFSGTNLLAHATSDTRGELLKRLALDAYGHPQQQQPKHFIAGADGKIRAATATGSVCTSLGVARPSEGVALNQCRVTHPVFRGKELPATTRGRRMMRANSIRAGVLALVFALSGCAGGNEQAAAPSSVPLPTRAPATVAPQATAAEPTSAPAATAALVPTAASEPTAAPATAKPAKPTLQEYDVPRGTHPHDVAPAPDGRVWYTAQATGELGILDPQTGETRHIKLGNHSAPHGVIVGPDGAPWITDGGQNAIVRVDPATEEVTVFPLPNTHPAANLNTAAFDASGVLWFTGQTGVYGRLNPAVGTVEAFDAPRGRGPYGITATPDGRVFYASLAGSHIAEINTETGEATPIDSPTAGQGARRVWSDSQGRIWVSEWNAGQVGVYNPADGSWREWKLPGERPQAYAVYVDERDMVWLTDFGGNAIVRFAPATEAFESFPLPSSSASVRQLLGRPGELWGAESSVDKIIVIRYG